MDFDQPARDCKSETRALLFVKICVRTACGRQGGDLLGRHAAAVIGDGDLVKAVGDAADDFYSGAGFREFEGVVEDFAENFFEFRMGNANEGFGDIDFEIGDAIESAPPPPVTVTSPISIARWTCGCWERPSRAPDLDLVAVGDQIDGIGVGEQRQQAHRLGAEREGDVLGRGVELALPGADRQHLRRFARLSSAARVSSLTREPSAFLRPWLRPWPASGPFAGRETTGIKSLAAAAAAAITSRTGTAARRRQSPAVLQLRMDPHHGRRRAPRA